MSIAERLRELAFSGGLDLPFPGAGQTAIRHQKLAELARVDLPLARIAEAHVDALSILAEAGRKPQSGIYGVWAAETAGQPLHLRRAGAGDQLAGTKMFCSGAGLVDRALIAVDGYLVDVGLKEDSETLNIDGTSWKTCAFAETSTATVHFSNTPVAEIIGEQKWYLDRPGFWHGACGPAACWAGGAIGLFEYALCEKRDDAHTMAHLGAMGAAVWGLRACLDSAGDEIDSDPCDKQAAMLRALTLRHLVESACSDILRRLGRAYGPRPLAFDSVTSRRYQELELYIRQSHAERDLESLGRQLHSRKRLW